MLLIFSSVGLYAMGGILAMKENVVKKDYISAAVILVAGLLVVIKISLRM